VVTRQFDATKSLSITGQNFVAFRDYIPRDQGGPTRTIEGVQVVFGGDLANIPGLISPADAAGKVIVIRNQIAPLVNQQQFNDRYGQAAGILLTSMDRIPEEIVAALRESQMEFNPQASSTVVPTFAYVTTAMAERLMGGKIEGMRTGTAGATMRGSIAFNTVPSANPVRNVIGIVRGTDAALRNEYVVVGAHSDHVGTEPVAVDHDSLLLANRMFRRGGADSPEPQLSAQQLAQLRAARDSVARLRAPRRDSIYNGADDDASGSMAILEVAELFARGNQKPRRSVLFIWQTSEELGLWGSEYFTDHPTVPRGNIVANINIDMIGRGGPQDIENGGNDYLQLLGSKRLSQEYGALVERVNAKPEHSFRLDYAFDAPGHPQQYYCRSDHWNYARYGIPTVFFSTGGHADYHMLTDEPQYINYPHYLKVTRFIADVAMTVAAMDARPKLDKPAPGPTAQCVQ
jgi:hypothetical protein